MDGRDKPGHDGGRRVQLVSKQALSGSTDAVARQAAQAGRSRATGTSRIGQWMIAATKPSAIATHQNRS